MVDIAGRDHQASRMQRLLSSIDLTLAAPIVALMSLAFGAIVAEVEQRTH